MNAINLLVGSALLLTTGTLYAADNPITRAVESIPESAAWDWLENSRDSVSEGVTTVGRNLDDWLAGEGVGERENQSYLRLKINQHYGRFDNYNSRLRISGKVDLPRATERWKLIFESEDTQLDSLRDQRLNNINSTSILGGFSYELPERDGWRLSNDIGIKGDIPLDPFYRFKTRYGKDINENWYGGLDHKIWYYHTDGWGQDMRVYFSRQLRPGLNFRIDSEVNFKDKNDFFEFGQYFSLHRSLGERETLTYEFGLIGMSQPNPRVENYYVQSVYRKAIYEDWLVLELVPQLIAAREDSWKPDPQIQVNLEIYFFSF